MTRIVKFFRVCLLIVWHSVRHPLTTTRIKINALALAALSPLSADAGGYCRSYCYPVKAYVAPVYKPPVYNQTTNTTTYTYNITNQQAAAPQGNTLYGQPATSLSLASYGRVDVGATVDGLLRLSSDLQAGATTVAGDVRGLVGDVAAFQAQQNQGVIAVAELQAKTELLRAAQPSPQLNFQLQQQQRVGGQFNGAPSPWGPLVTQHCSSCHGPGGSNVDSFSLESLRTFEGFRAAMARVTTDNPQLRMPRGVELDPTTRGSLIQELSR